jgi:hypothetical protein
MSATDRTTLQRGGDSLVAPPAVMGAATSASLPTRESEAPLSAAASGPAIAARIVGSGELRAMGGAWRDLFHGCAEPNPFYGPDFLLPLLAFDRKLARTRFLIAETRLGPRTELAALCPIMPTGLGLPGLRRSIGTARHPYIFNHLPLLRAGREASLWRAMLDALEAAFRRGVLVIPSSPLGSPAARALRDALAASGRASFVLAHGERAAIIAAGGVEAHLASIKARTLAKMRHHERELRKLGQVRYVSAVSGAGLAEAVEAFIALEARGWKGRQGSAFACDPRALAFARQALSGAADAPGARVDYLTLDGTTIGACLHLATRGYSATFKIAYDETLAKYAPGVLAMFMSLQSLLAEPWTQRLDSGVGPDHAVGAIWRDRLAFGDILGVLSPRQGQHELRLHVRADALFESARARAREAYYALTGRKRTVTRKG